MELWINNKDKSMIWNQRSFDNHLKERKTHSIYYKGERIISFAQLIAVYDGVTLPRLEYDTQRTEWNARMMFNYDEWDGDLKSFSSTQTKDSDFFIAAVCSPKWNGNCHRMMKYYREHDVFDYVLNSKNWNGDASRFGSNRLDWLNDCCSIIRSRRWNGDLSIFPEKILKRDRFIRHVIECTVLYKRPWKVNCLGKICNPENGKKLIALKLWGGSYDEFGKSMMKDESFIEAIVKSPLWDGRCDLFTPDEWSRELMTLICNSPRWNGDISKFWIYANRFDELAKFIPQSYKNDVDKNELLLMTISSKFETVIDARDHIMKGNWDGKLDDFHPRILFNESFTIWMTLVASNGKFKGLDESLLRTRRAVSFITRSVKWDGDCSYFGKEILAMKKFVLENIVFSGMWNGDCRYFSEELLSDWDFVSKVIYSPFWDGDMSHFGENILSDEEKLTDIIMSDMWNGSEEAIKASDVDVVDLKLFRVLSSVNVCNQSQ